MLLILSVPVTPRTGLRLPGDWPVTPRTGPVTPRTGPETRDPFVKLPESPGWLMEAGGEKPLESYFPHSAIYRRNQYSDACI